MKIALPSILLLSLFALSKGQSAGPGPIAAENYAPSATADATEEAAVNGDAGQECAAGECAASDENGADESTETETVAESADESTEATAESATEEEDANCPSRPHVIRCAAKYLDTNQNGRLEREELESVMQTVPWLLRGLLNMIGSVDTIMKKCDADGDGSITIDVDMEATKETCLATCFKRYAFKKLFFPDCKE